MNVSSRVNLDSTGKRRNFSHPARGFLLPTHGCDHSPQSCPRHPRLSPNSLRLFQSSPAHSWRCDSFQRTSTSPGERLTLESLVKSWRFKKKIEIESFGPWRRRRWPFLDERSRKPVFPLRTDHGKWVFLSLKTREMGNPLDNSQNPGATWGANPDLNPTEPRGAPCLVFTPVS